MESALDGHDVFPSVSGLIIVGLSKNRQVSYRRAAAAVIEIAYTDTLVQGRHALPGFLQYIHVKEL
jgi:hypothetical protein